MDRSHAQSCLAGEMASMLHWLVPSGVRKSRSVPMTRNVHRLAAFAAIATLVAAQPAAAEEWPTRPLSLVVPFAAGSASDTVARILGARLSEVLGQQVVIENIGGAGGMTGASRVAKAAPDGYQFVMGGVDTF